jgi:phosphomannomutase
MGIILEAMARRRSPVADLAARLPRLCMLKGTVASSAERIYPVIDAFRSRYRGSSPNLEDGVRVDWPDAWLHVRASNTEPLIRVIVEAEEAARARQLYDEALDDIRRMQAGRSGA